MGSRTHVLARDVDVAAPTAGPVAAPPTRRTSVGDYLSRHRGDRSVATAVTLLVFAASWYRHATFRSNTYDLAVFEQVVWRMAHGHGATSTLTAWNAFADHLSPILLVFVPLYRIAATPLWFFGAQAAAVGLSVLCVRPLAAAAGLRRDSVTASALVALFAFHPSVWNAALYDFHPTTLAIPVLLFGCTAGLRNHARGLWLAFALLLVLRDDLALAAAAMGCVGWWSDTRTGRKQRAALVAAALGWTVLGAQIGSAMGASRHFVVRYGYLGGSMTDAAQHPIHAGVGLVQHILVRDNILFAIVLLAPLLFLPLRRPAWFALAAFVAVPALAAVDVNFHSPGVHYGGPIVPFLILGTAGALAASPESQRERMRVLAIAATAIVFSMLGPIGNHALTRPGIDPGDARAALKLVHDDDVVVASNSVGTHLGRRDVLLPYPYPFVAVDFDFPLDPRVTSTAPARQQQVDVIVVGHRGAKAERLLTRLARAPDVARNFTRTDFGTVTVFRRTA